MTRATIRIDDPADTRLDPYRNIREKDLVQRQNRFIAEGRSVLNVLAAQSRFGIESVLLLENRVAGLEDLIAKLLPRCPVYVVSADIMDTVAGFPMHRGILAVGIRPANANTAPDANVARDWKRVVALSGLSNHDNVGAIFRNAAAFGADAILMDTATCDPLYRKAIRVSVGGVLKVPFHAFASTGAMLNWLSENNFETVALSPAGKSNLADWSPSTRTAILLGAEGPGLPQHVLDALPSLSIEMGGGFDSLNVATASGIALHHMLVRQG